MKHIFVLSIVSSIAFADMAPSEFASDDCIVRKMGDNCMGKGGYGYCVAAKCERLIPNYKRSGTTSSQAVDCLKCDLNAKKPERNAAQTPDAAVNSAETPANKIPTSRPPPENPKSCQSVPIQMTFIFAFIALWIRRSNT